MSWTIMRGDAMHIPLGDETVQMVATSPPFYGLRSYSGVAPALWPAVTYAPMAGLAPITVPEMTCCLGLEATPEAYVGHLVAIFREVWRVLRDDGTVFCNLGDSYWGSYIAQSRIDGRGDTLNSANIAMNHKDTRYNINGLKPKDLIGIPWRVALALQADRWTLRSDLIWAKGISFCETYSGSVMPESVTDRCTKAHEYIFMLAKSQQYYFDQEAIKEKSTFNPNWHEPDVKYVRPVSGNGESARSSGWHGIARAGFGRNPRSVWAINPGNFEGAHFACWPPSLVAKMIAAGTSERGCCPKCGAPYQRIVERTKLADIAVSATGGGQKHEARIGMKLRSNKSGLFGSNSHNASTPQSPIVETLGWRPSCSCDAGEPIPCLVADIFSGAGTTVMQALRMGLSAVGLDLSHEYCGMARDRIVADCPLFNAVDAAK